MKPEKKRNQPQKSTPGTRPPLFNLEAWDLPIPTPWLWAGLFALALGVKLICLIQYTASPDFALPVGDSEIYLTQARRILAGGFFLGDVVPFQTPLYPAFMALWLGLFKENFFLLRLVQILLGAANVVVIYALTLRLARGSRPAALLGALAAVGYGTLSFFDIDLLGIFFTVFTLDLAVLLMIKHQETAKLRWVWISGVCFGLATLERANLLLFVPVAVWYLAGRFSLSIQNIRHWAWKPALGFLAGAMLMILPVTVNNFRVAHDFVLITYNAGVNLYFGNNPSASGTQDARGNPELTNSEMEKSAIELAEKETGRKMKPSEISRFWARKAFRFILTEPGQMLRLYARKIRLLANPAELPNHLSYEFMSHEFIPFLRWLFLNLGVIAPWAAVGLVAQWRRGLTLADKLFLGLLVTYVLSLLPFFITDRYRLPVVPFLIAFAAVGVFEALRLAFNRSWKPLAWLGVVLLVAGWAVNQPFPFRLTFGHSRVTLGDRYADRSEANPQPGNPDLIQAILEYKQALEASPGYAMACMRLARVYETVGYYSGNLRLLDRIDQLDPSQKARVAGIRANIRARLAAEGDLASEADIPKTPFEKALADEEAGETDRAMEKYWDIIGRDPYHVPAFDHLGTLYLKRGEKNQAADIFNQGLEKNPDSLPLMDDLAETRYQQGETGEYNRLKRRIGELRGNR